MNRREFLLTAGTAAAAGAWPGLTGPKKIAIVRNPGDPVASSAPARWALGELRGVLEGRGIAVSMKTKVEDAPAGALCLVMAGRGSALAGESGFVPPARPEALAIGMARAGSRQVLLAIGSDGRGLAYALSELADVTALSGDPLAALAAHPRRIERPANRVRSVMRTFVSSLEDKPWFTDRAFWRRYLTFLAAQRFNRFQLALGIGYDVPENLTDTTFYFAYPFFLSVPGYRVAASGLSEAERDRNLEMLRFASDQAAACGMEFQLGLWSHAYRWTDSPRANHTIAGLTPESHAPYCRDALALLLKECPGISGITLRVHGESGVPEGSYDFWRMLFQGCVSSGRPIRLDMHAKGFDQRMIDLALESGLPVAISPKFSAEHMGLPYHQAAIRALERAVHTGGGAVFGQSLGSRRFTRYSYGDFLLSDRRYDIIHRIWPGTQRLLLWGDPRFAAAYSRASGMAGSAGCEIIEPLSFKGCAGSGLAGGREGYADPSLRSPGGGFEKFRHTYRVFGRMLYDPGTDSSAWRRPLIREFGAAAAPAVESSLAHASRILPLVTSAHLPSGSHHRYWPEMYWDMPIAALAPPDTPYGDTPAPKRFGTVSPLDPQLFYGVDEYVEAALKGDLDGRYTPIQVAQWLDRLADAAAAQLSLATAGFPVSPGPAVRRMAIDIKVQTGLGRFFAGKFRAAVQFAVFERKGERAALEGALQDYRRARRAWADVVAATRDVYAAEVNFGQYACLRGDWADRLPAIDRDLEAMDERAGTAVSSESTSLGAVMRAAAPFSIGLTHTPSATFRPGLAVGLSVAPTGSQAPPLTVRLHYRRMNQAEAWMAVAMSAGGAGWSASIPADYAGASYPLQYYFTAANSSDDPMMFPGLGPHLDQQPYFVISPSNPKLS